MPYQPPDGPPGAPPPPPSTPPVTCPPQACSPGMFWDSVLCKCKLEREGDLPPGPPKPSEPPNAPPGGGVCPPNTPPGPATCCPAGTVWRTDSRKCEPPDERSRNGLETCPEPASAHINCPPNQTWCDFDTASWRCAGAPGGGGGGGGRGGAGGGGGTTKPNFTDPALAQSGYLWSVIEKMLGGPSRYTPEVMSSLMGGIKTGAERAAANQTEESNADLASRGIARSTVAAEAQRGIRANVYDQVLEGRNQINRAKIDADYQDKLAALQAAQQWIDSLRNFVAQSNATQAQKEAAMANITLGYARLQQEQSMMRENYAQQIQLLLLGRG